MNHHNHSKENRKNHQNRNLNCDIEPLKSLNNYEEVKNFLDKMDNFTKECFLNISYTKVRKYYDKILKILEKEKNNVEVLKSKLKLEIEILMDYDIGRDNKNKNLENLKKFFNKTLELLDKENGKELFEKNWEILVAYSRKNLKNQ